MLTFNAYFWGLLVLVKQVIRGRKHSSPVWAGQGISGTGWRGEQGNSATGLMGGQIGVDWGWQNADSKQVGCRTGDACEYQEKYSRLV